MEMGRLGSKEKRGEKMRDIQNDLFDVKETCCESCQYNMPGKTWCLKYKRIKPVSVMIGRIKCEKYCMLNNVIMASIVGFAVALELHMMPYVVNLLNITQKTRYNLRLQIFSQERYFLCQHQVLSHLDM